MTAWLHLGDQEGALTVPQSAVGASQIGRFLVVVGKVEQHMIKRGDNDGDLVMVNDDLQTGDRVITWQLQKLKPGAPVDPEDSASPPAAK